MPSAYSTRFGEENRIAVLVFDRNRKNDAKFFSVGHEYMIVYAKNQSLLREQGVELRVPKEGIDDVRGEFERLAAEHKKDWGAVARGLRDYFKTFSEDDPRKPLARFTKVDERGPYRDDGDISWPGGGGPRYDVLHPKTKKPCKVPVSGWRFPTFDRMKEEISKGRVAFGVDETTVPALRRNLFEATDQLMGSVTFSYAQKAAQEFNAIFDNEKVFDNPKNYNDLARLFAYLGGDDDIVLDFFAGSGTTAHAVLDLNMRDGGRRRFIQVQLPEPTRTQSKDGLWAETNASKRGLLTIADITKERARRVIKKLDSADVGKLDLDNKGKQDRGFRVFKLAESNLIGWDGGVSKDAESLGNQLAMHIDHIRQGRTDQDLLYELLLKSGFPLTTKVETKQIAKKTVFSIAEGVMLICLDRKLTLELIRAMADLKPERVVCLDAGFHDNDQLKANAVQTFKSKGVVSFRTV
jgi:adenine-specific DNA-methyltransferase